MRLLIYLLALISGFSAADAARAQIAPASSVAQTAVAAAEAFTAQDQVKLGRRADEKPSTPAYVFPAVVAVVRAANTPVALHDLIRE